MTLTKRDMRKIPVIALLSGLDPTGGAGLLADIRASAAAGVRIAPLMTANTIQGKEKTALYSVVNADFLAEQLDTINQQFSIKVVKIGMMGNAATARIICDKLKKYRWLSVLDPVMYASSGGLLADAGVRSEILDMAEHITLLTPNRHELAWLSERNIVSMEDTEAAVTQLYQQGFRSIFVKGGHFDGNPVDYFYTNGRLLTTYTGVRYSHTVRGTGCHFATFAAAMIAKGATVTEAVSAAYSFVQRLFIDYCDSGNGILPADSPDYTHQNNV